MHAEICAEVERVITYFNHNLNNKHVYLFKFFFSKLIICSTSVYFTCLRHQFIILNELFLNGLLQLTSKRELSRIIFVAYYSSASTIERTISSAKHKRNRNKLFTLSHVTSKDETFSSFQSHAVPYNTCRTLSSKAVLVHSVNKKIWHISSTHIAEIRWQRQRWRPTSNRQSSVMV